MNLGNPADQFEAFRELHEERGWGAEEIAARFGITAHVVRQRLRLGAVSPKLMQEYRDSELTLDPLMAFAICGDSLDEERIEPGSNRFGTVFHHHVMHEFALRNAANAQEAGFVAGFQLD